jgi:hypothetical protein|nr:MAG TPA_asm: hypothetical protein [Caudoviricetes sp.]
MKSYDRICRIDIDDIIKESQGEDIEYIRDGDRSADDLDVICDFMKKGYLHEIRCEKEFYHTERIVIKFSKIKNQEERL